MQRGDVVVFLGFGDKHYLCKEHHCSAFLEALFVDKVVFDCHTSFCGIRRGVAERAKLSREVVVCYTGV